MAQIQPHPIGLMVLAAGASTRMKTPKQLLPIGKHRLLRHSVLTAIASNCPLIVVVLGANAAKIRLEIDDLPVHIVENLEWQAGMGTSITAGLKSLLELEPTLKAAIVLLCDQPFVSMSLINQLIATYHSTTGSIIASAYAQMLGVPALFSDRHFPELLTLDANAGAKQLIQQHLDQVYSIPFPEGAIDLDTPHEYRSFLIELGKIDRRLEIGS
jgi:molybdenum cofactor cytidylyltransferase